MTDYEDLQKRCQRGATNLHEAHDIMAACYGMLWKLGAENARLRKECDRLKADNQALMESPEDAL